MLAAGKAVKIVEIIMNNPKREISAGFVIYRKTKDGLKFLLLYHGRDYWNFPKGHIESEERSLEAAIRETREETGFLLRDLKLSRHFKAYEKFYFWRPPAQIGGRPQRIFKIVIFYLAEAKKSAVKISDEHEGYAWFLYKDALKILSKHKDSQKVIIQANDFLHNKRQTKGD